MQHIPVNLKVQKRRVKFDVYVYANHSSMHQGLNRYCKRNKERPCQSRKYYGQTIAIWLPAPNGSGPIYPTNAKPKSVAVFVYQPVRMAWLIHELEHVAQFLFAEYYKPLAYPQRRNREHAGEMLADIVGMSSEYVWNEIQGEKTTV